VGIRSRGDPCSKQAWKVLLVGRASFTSEVIARISHAE